MKAAKNNIWHVFNMENLCMSAENTSKHEKRNFVSPSGHVNFYLMTI